MTEWSGRQVAQEVVFSMCFLAAVSDASWLICCSTDRPSGSNGATNHSQGSFFLGSGLKGQVSATQYAWLTCCSAHGPGVLDGAEDHGEGVLPGRRSGRGVHPAVQLHGHLREHGVGAVTLQVRLLYFTHRGEERFRV